MFALHLVIWPWSLRCFVRNVFSFAFEVFWIIKTKTIHLLKAKVLLTHVQNGKSVFEYVEDKENNYIICIRYG